MESELAMGLNAGECKVNGTRKWMYLNGKWRELENECICMESEWNQETNIYMNEVSLMPDFHTWFCLLCFIINSKRNKL